MTPREERLLDAAVEVLADGGGRQLTHRAVDARAGVPLGSASNLFRTRDALLAGVLARVLERETAVWLEVDAGIDTSDVRGLATAMGRLVRALTDEHATLTRARLAVFAEARGRAPLRAEVQRARGEIAGWAAPALARVGSRDPAHDVGCLLALVEGLLTGRLTDPSPGPDPAGAVEALLRGLLAGPPDRPDRPDGG